MKYTETEQFKQFGILLARVDDRLVHGQVVVAWNSVLRTKNIIVSSDAIAGDEFRRMMIENAAAPGDINVRVYGIDELHKRTRDGEYKKGKVIIIFESPSEVLRFLSKGDILDSINIGGMHKRPGKAEYETALWLDDNDISDLKELRRRGKELVYQMVPVENGQPLTKLFEENGIE